jgi:putative spermidine/putrescine transport system ATP-binding protein
MSEITLDHVTKRFGDTTAMDDVTLTITDGEVLGVVGPSGCGKTTTLRTIAGFETPTAGAVRFDGEDVTGVPPERRNVGLVFQEYALFDNMTVRENVAFGPKMRGVGRTERHERAEELLDMLGIGGMGNRDPATLSGGQQQRVGLARALAIEPNILLLDEPMTGLDEKLKRRLRTEMADLLDRLGVTALYVTHDQTEAMSMCDRIAVMDDGRVVQEGTPREVYERPADPFVAGFVGTSNLLSGTVADGQLDLGYAALPAPNAPDGATRIVVRPDDVTLGEGDVTATVADVAYLGETVQATLELPDGEQLVVEPDRRTVPSPGDELQMTIEHDRVHVVEGGGTADGAETGDGARADD